MCMPGTNFANKQKKGLYSMMINIYDTIEMQNLLKSQ